MLVSILSVHCVVYVVYQFVWLRVVGGSGHYILCVFLIMSQSCDHYIITVKRLSRMWLEILRHNFGEINSQKLRKFELVLEQC